MQGDETIVAPNLESDSPDASAAEDLEVLRFIADVAAISIERAHLRACRQAASVRGTLAIPWKSPPKYWRWLGRPRRRHHGHTAVDVLADPERRSSRQPSTDRARAVHDELEARARHEVTPPVWIAAAASAAGLDDPAMRFAPQCVTEHAPLTLWSPRTPF